MRERKVYKLEVKRLDPRAFVKFNTPFIVIGSILVPLRLIAVAGCGGLLEAILVLAIGFPFFYFLCFLAIHIQVRLFNWAISIMKQGPVIECEEYREELRGMTRRREKYLARKRQERDAAQEAPESFPEPF